MIPMKGSSRMKKGLFGEDTLLPEALPPLQQMLLLIPMTMTTDRQTQTDRIFSLNQFSFLAIINYVYQNTKQGRIAKSQLHRNNLLRNQCLLIMLNILTNHFTETLFTNIIALFITNNYYQLDINIYIRLSTLTHCYLYVLINYLSKCSCFRFDSQFFGDKRKLKVN